MPTDESDGPLEAAWERMMDGAERRRKARQRSLAVGLLMPIAAVVVLVILLLATK